MENKHTKSAFITMLSVLFIVLKITNYINWDWFFVLLPCTFGFMVIGVYLVVASIKDKESFIEMINDLKIRKHSKINDNMNMWEMLTIAFIGLKLTEKADFNWFIIICPLIIDMFLEVILKKD